MTIADAFNLGCQCKTLDKARLLDELGRDAGLKTIASSLAQTHPHLFSNSVVFVASATVQAMAQAIGSIERVMALPAYQAHALASAPAIARQQHGPLGVFMGYDFHVDAHAGALGQSPGQPRLIEINTNAGGALLSAALARSQRACCQPMADGLGYNTRLDALDQTWFAMFQNEWRLQRGDAPLRTVAIVDDTPETQYLAPEFALFRQLFQSRGVSAFIAAPGDLTWRDGKLWLAPGATKSEAANGTKQAIDLVYNRLTDFDLSEASHAALHHAYEAGAVVLTPHPHAHALRANKRHLVSLSRGELLASWGVSQPDLQILDAAIPKTVLCAEQAAAGEEAALWADRRHLFFKPVAGYGGKAAYRGDKLTKRAWQDVLAGDFVAQTIAPPGLRVVDVDGVATSLKFDIRAYTYQGKIQLLTARTYNGQTTNFRTPGGGFSPVLVVPESTAFQPLLPVAEAPVNAPAPCAC
jgi:hypothetical protein